MCWGNIENETMFYIQFQQYLDEPKNLMVKCKSSGLKCQENWILGMGLFTEANFTPPLKQIDLTLLCWEITFLMTVDANELYRQKKLRLNPSEGVPFSKCKFEKVGKFLNF